MCLEEDKGECGSQVGGSLGVRAHVGVKKWRWCGDFPECIENDIDIISFATPCLFPFLLFLSTAFLLSLKLYSLSHIISLQ